MYPIETVDSQRAISYEQLGTKKKFWYEDDEGRLKLFKAEERGYGEDWSEKIVCELAGPLGIPRVHYDMALDIATKVPGVVCADFQMEGQQLVHGNTLLQVQDPKYPKNTLRVASHTIDAVYEILRWLAPPELRWNKDSPAEMTNGAEVFCGYLLLDAWVANQDRHHENWAAIWDINAPQRDQFRLAPSYDHGSSLARNVSDKEKARRLRSTDSGYRIVTFARRARSKLFASAEDERPLRTLDAFLAFSRQVPEAATIWRDRLQRIKETTITKVLAEVPPNRLSAVGRDFTLQLLLENRRRILESRETEE